MSIQEHWTSTQQALVVSADATTIRRIVDALDIPSAEPVDLNRNQVVLPLWGHALERYCQYRQRVTASNLLSDALVSHEEQLAGSS